MLFKVGLFYSDRTVIQKMKIILNPNALFNPYNKVKF